LSVVRRPAERIVSEDSNLAVVPSAATTLVDESFGMMSLRVVPFAVELIALTG